MKKFKKALALVVAFVMAVSVLAVAPSTSVSAAPSKYVKSLKVSKSKLTLEAGKSAKVKATVKVKGSASKKVKVTLSKANKKVVKSVKVGKPDKKGVSTLTIKAANVTKKASTTIKVVTSAKNSKNKKITKKIKVTVNPKKAAVVTPQSVTVNAPKTAITVGETIIVTATVLPANAQDKSVTYSTSNAAVATVTNTGAVLGIGEGTATITAKTSNGKTGSVQITVSKVDVTGIALNTNSVELLVTGTTTLSPTIIPANATNKTVTWASSDETVATVKDGQVTAVGVGTAIITATTANGIKAECTVKVTSKVTTEAQTTVTLELTNPYKTEEKKYDNIKLVGDDMYIQARVMKGDQPVGNTIVTLKIANYLPYGTLEDAFTVRNGGSAVTNGDGYANFALGLRENFNSLNALSGEFQGLELAATEASTNATAALNVGYASFEVNNINVLNGEAPMWPAIVPSDNASIPADTGLYTTSYIEDELLEEYVSSQRVSATDADHRVYLTAAPYLLIPELKGNQEMSSWEYKVENGASGACSVYNDATNETTTVQVTDIPAGLRYLTLLFDEISLSKYIVMDVDIYEKGTGKLLHHRSVTKEQESSFELIGEQPAIQIEQQWDVDSYLVVSLRSQGQVDTTHKGYVLTKLEGVYRTDRIALSAREEVLGSVKWETTSAAYEKTDWSYEEALKYLPAQVEDSDVKFLSKDYIYSYQVPAFPNTGDAVIVVKDSNAEKPIYFLYPTVNNGSNKNVLAPPRGDIKAIYASEEEVSQVVGSLTLDGNMAIVDSTKAGRTNLKATITLPGLHEQNGGLLYTSIQWAPNPIAEKEEENPDFFAIEGQNVVITAQLTDAGGNKKSDTGKKVEFLVGEQKIEAVGDNIGFGATVVDITNQGATDAKGQVKLTLSDVTTEELPAYVEKLTAKTTGYNVKLTIGSDTKEVDVADIYWVDLGLTFVDSAINADDVDENSSVVYENPVRTTQFANSTMDIAKEAEYVVSDKNGWQIGYKVVARSKKFINPFYEEENLTKPELPVSLIEEYVNVAGVGIEYEKNSENVSLTPGKKDSVAVLATTVAGEAELTGTIKITDSAAVKFTFLNDKGEEVTYSNIGVDATSAENTALKLKTKWSTDGVKLSVQAPGNVYTGTEAVVYVMVLDNYGNPIKDATINYTVTGVNATEGQGKTSEKGVLPIVLPAVNVSEKTTSKITVGLNGRTDTIIKDINYIPAAVEDKAFTLRDETETSFAVAVSEDKKNITLYFSNPVDESAIKAKMFEFVQDGSNDNTYVVTAATKGSENNSIVLTLDQAIKSINSNHTLTIKSYTDKATDIVYELLDKNGQKYTGVGTYQMVPAQRQK